MDCIFCNIVNHTEQAEVLFESDKVLAFLDINPVNFGHALVITKNHYPDFLTVPKDELDQVVNTVQAISDVIKHKLNSDGFNIVINNGTAAGQTVPHFHFHIIPRFHNDDFRFKLNLKKYSDNLMKEYADKIRAELK
ncbi:MAG: HIT family protein [Ignavibacteriaceae bacterium]|jgi:histidine triad (HIT) family protein|nr:HIT family protein [Ignavibacteriaceae bacterium]